MRIGSARFANKPWLLQRHSGEHWFDADGFDTKDAAIRALGHAQNADDYRIRSDGGSGFTGRRSQKMRVVQVVQVVA